MLLLMSAGLIIPRKIQDDNNRSDTRAPQFELVRNPLTLNKTVECDFMRYEIVLYFTLLHNKDIHKNITPYLHAQNVKTNETILLDDHCFIIDNSKLRCLAWNLNNLKHGDKYKLWLTKNKNTNILWQSKKHLNVAKHMFGCIKHNINNLKIANIEHSSVTLKWEITKTISIFKPKFEIFVNGIKLKKDITCPKIDGCEAKIYNILSCEGYKFCVRTNYTHRYLPKYIKLTESCIKYPLHNCTLKPTPPPEGEEKGIQFFPIIVFAVFISIVITLVVLWRLIKKKNKKNKKENYDDDGIQPRQEPIYEIIEETHIEYYDSDSIQNQASPRVVSQSSSMTESTYSTTSDYHYPRWFLSILGKVGLWKRQKSYKQSLIT